MTFEGSAVDFFMLSLSGLQVALWEVPFDWKGTTYYMRQNALDQEQAVAKTERYCRDLFGPNEVTVGTPTKLKAFFEYSPLA